MRFTTELAAARSVRAAQRFFMSKFQAPVLLQTAFKGIFQHPGRAWLGVACCLLLGSSAFSQTIVSQDLAQYGLVITAPDTLLMKGETAVLSIATSSAATDAVEINVQLELGANAVPNLIPALDLSDSWFFVGTPSQSITGRAFRVTGQRDPAASGHGELFQIELEAATDHVQAAHLIDGGGGHVLIIVEDSGFKREPESQTTSGLRLFPQPFHDQLSFGGMEALQSLALYGMDGRLIRQAPPEVLQVGNWHLGDLEAGLYLAVWTGPDGRGHARIEKR